MQPLKTMIRPRAASTIGWDAAGDKSMLESRRCSSATGPRAQMPEPSGPRGASLCAGEVDEGAEVDVPRLEAAIFERREGRQGHRLLSHPPGGVREDLLAPTVELVWR